MKNNKGISSIVLLIIAIIILVVAGIFWMYTQGMFGKKDETKKTSQVANQTKISQPENEIEEDDDYIPTNQVDNEEEEEDDDQPHVSSKILESWFGKYVLDDEKYIVIYRNDRDTLALNIVTGFSFLGEANVEVESAEKATYENTSFGTTEKIDLELNNGILTVKASSSEEDSELNNINGEYKKDETIKNNDWDGYYENDDYKIVIAYDFDEKLNITINDYWGRYIEEFDDNKINYEGDFFDDKEKFVIEKTETGIKIVEASSTNSEDILNEIKGIQLKKVVD